MASRTNSKDKKQALQNVRFFIDDSAFSELIKRHSDNTADDSEIVDIKLKSKSDDSDLAIKVNRSKFESIIDDDDFYFDIIEQPFQFAVKGHTKSIDLKLYLRSVFGVSDDYHCCMATVHRDGEITDVEDKGGISNSVETMLLMLAAGCELRRYIEENNLKDKYAGMDPEFEGVNVSFDGDELIFKRISGKDRPTMVGTNVFGSLDEARPYPDEIMSAFESMHESFEEKLERAEDGDEDAMAEVAQTYNYGDEENGIEMDLTKALYWYEKLAEKGNAIAQFNAGINYAKGAGTARNLEKAVYWMRQAAENGDEDAVYQLKLYERTIAAIKKAKRGDAQAQADYGRFLMEMGRSVSQAGEGDDLKESVKWLKKAADQGNGDGIWGLALAYEHGRGVAADRKKAIELYKKGAELGHPASINSLACYYLRGEIKGKTKKQTIEMITKAANLGDPDAMKNLGNHYAYDDDDMEKAVYWYEKYLEQRHDEEIDLKVRLYKRTRSSSDTSTPKSGSKKSKKDDSKKKKQTAAETKKAEKPKKRNSKPAVITLKRGDMIVDSVGDTARRVSVFDDFSVMIPQGCCYDINECTQNQIDHVLTILGPAWKGEAYKEGVIAVSPDRGVSYLIELTRLDTAVLSDDADEVPYDIEEFVKTSSEDAVEFRVDEESGELIKDNKSRNFRRMYKVVKDEPFLKAGFYTQGMMGETIFIIMIVTAHALYTSGAIRFGSDDVDENANIITDFLSSLKALNVRKHFVEEVRTNRFKKPTYDNNTRVIVDDLSFALPDGFEYVTEKHCPKNDKRAWNLLRNYSLIAAPEDCKNGLRGYKDAPLGIGLSAAEESGISLLAWLQPDSIIEAIENSGDFIDVFEAEKGLIIGFRKGVENKPDEENEWVSYAISVYHNNTSYFANLFFNGKKTTDKNYEQAVRTFCSEIRIALDDEIDDRKAEITFEADLDEVPDRISSKFRKQDPSEDQHTHLDFQRGTGGLIGMFGGRVQNGMEYAFLPIDSLQPEDETLNKILRKAESLDSQDYALADTALQMAGIFRVRSDAFDPSHDREEEIEQGYLHKAVYYDALRSFAWTLAAYCDDENEEPDSLSIENLQELSQFIEERACLNYSDSEYCPALCAGDDIHVLFLPEAVSAKDKKAAQKILNSNENDKSRECIVSLDGLREDLAYLYPAMTTIYDHYAGNDRSKELGGGLADILYAWCAVTYAARNPFFTEDGPMSVQFVSVGLVASHYEEPDRISMLQGTQYDGRLERCEFLKAGDELTCKVIKDNYSKTSQLLIAAGNTDPEVLEVFYKGKSVGVINDWTDVFFNELLGLLKKDRIDLNATVVSCVPKSQRGSRARTAEVAVKLHIKEKPGKVGLKALSSDEGDLEEIPIADRSSAVGDETQLDLKGIKKRIKGFKRAWTNEIRTSNEEIVGDKPFTRSNDARIKKLRNNTESILEKHAEELQGIMERLNLEGDRRRTGEESEENIKEIAVLMADAYDALHMEIEVKIDVRRESFKHTIDRKFTSMAGKWKKIYNQLPTVKREVLTEQLDKDKEQLKLFRKELSTEKGKKTRLEKKLPDLEAAEMAAKEARDAAHSLVDPDQPVRIEKLEKKVTKLKEQLSSIDQEIKSIVGSLASESRHYDGRIGYLKRQVERFEKKIDEQKKTLEAALNDETVKKTALDKAFLFKKSKREAYEAAVSEREKAERALALSELELKNSREAIDKESAEYQEKTNQWEKEKAELTGKRESLQPDLDKHKEKLSLEQSVYEESVENEEKAAEVYEKEAQKLKSQRQSIEEASARINELDESIRSLEERIDRQEKEL